MKVNDRESAERVDWTKVELVIKQKKLSSTLSLEFSVITAL